MTSRDIAWTGLPKSKLRPPGGIERPSEKVAPHELHMKRRPLSVAQIPTFLMRACWLLANVISALHFFRGGCISKHNLWGHPRGFREEVSAGVVGAASGASLFSSSHISALICAFESSDRRRHHYSRRC